MAIYISHKTEFGKNKKKTFQLILHAKCLVSLV